MSDVLPTRVDQNPYAPPRSAGSEAERGDGGTVSAACRHSRAKLFAAVLAVGGVVSATAVIARSYNSFTTVFGGMKYDDRTRNLNSGKPPSNNWLEEGERRVHEELVVEIQEILDATK